MARIQKTADELKTIIFDRIGVKVTVRPHETRGWTAIPFTSTPSTPAELRELDQLLIKLRNVYLLKPPSGTAAGPAAPMTPARQAATTTA